MSREATPGVSRRLELAIQLITGAAVLIGVVLVLIEQQQTRALTYKQMVQDRLRGCYRTQFSNLRRRSRDCSRKSLFKSRRIVSLRGDNS